MCDILFNLFSGHLRYFKAIFGQYRCVSCESEANPNNCVYFVKSLSSLKISRMVGVVLEISS